MPATAPQNPFGDGESRMRAVQTVVFGELCPFRPLTYYFQEVTALLINPQGEVVTPYRKMFPFYLYEVCVTPGSEFCVFDVPDVGRIGASMLGCAWDNP